MRIIKTNLIGGAAMNIDEKIEAILLAQKNQEDCPLCGAGCHIPAHVDHYENIQYEHDCECLLYLYFDKEDSYYNKRYAKRCHNCDKIDGVDSSLPECSEDPPYKYRCKYCGHSLRTQKEFGEGMTFDMAKFEITWRFNSKGHPTLINPTPITSKLII